MSRARDQREPAIGRTPTRTCVGCRRRAPQTALLRLALGGDPPRAIPDPRRRAPGRGAYVHRDRACVDRAIRRGALARALRAPRDAELTAGLAETLAAQISASERLTPPPDPPEYEGSRPHLRGSRGRLLPTAGARGGAKGSQ
jgi:predicted RNA-binding protein YlxR (DUF448 family)